MGNRRPEIERFAGAFGSHQPDAMIMLDKFEWDVERCQQELRVQRLDTRPTDCAKCQEVCT